MSNGYASQSYAVEDDTKAYAYGQGEEEDESMSPEDYWSVIDSFFGEKDDGKNKKGGLVRQQLESFNEFVENTMQEIVDERRKLMLDQHTQYTGVAGDTTVCGESRSIGA